MSASAPPFWTHEPAALLTARRLARLNASLQSGFD